MEDTVHNPNITVTVWVFKKNRASSTLKHTGIVLEIEAQGAVERWVHEVTGGTGNSAGSGWIVLGPEGNKSTLIIRTEKDNELATYEHHVPITTFVTDSPDAQAFFRSELFQYNWTYNVFFANCRDHVLHFVSRLQSYKILVHEGVVPWVKSIQTNDVLVGVTLVAGAMLLLYAANRNH